MSHAVHMSDPHFLMYQVLTPQVKKKPEPKATRTNGLLDSRAVKEINYDRDPDSSDSDESDADGSDAKRPAADGYRRFGNQSDACGGFDLTA